MQSYPELDFLNVDASNHAETRRQLHQIGMLAEMLLTYDEKQVFRCLSDLVAGDETAAAERAVSAARRGALRPDIYLLAGAFQLAYGQLTDAADSLRRCFDVDPEPGMMIRRLCPWLRIQLRIAPCVLLPVYPNAYGVTMMYAIALWRSGAEGEALEVMRYAVDTWGVNDEIRVIAGGIHLQRHDWERAVKALKTPEVTEQDSLELMRAMNLAWGSMQLEEYRKGARELIAALGMVKADNAALKARARQVLAGCYEHAGLLLDALRESGRVKPHDLPGYMADWVLAREERWVAELGLLTERELERMARADAYQMYVPEQVKERTLFSKLDTSRQVVEKLKPTAKSWRDRQVQERQINRIKAAAARGESVSLPGVSRLSDAAQDLKIRIGKAGMWWPSRRDALSRVRGNDYLARENPASVGHARYDYIGTREPPHYRLAGEKRAALLSWLALASVGIFILLLGLRSCAGY